jgi:TPP-dependent pyruvate/acetoin dehydrogenase alpha subunit
MKRYPAYDPPEYVTWSPDSRVMAWFRKTLEVDPARERLIASLRPADHLRLYRGLLRNRLHDIALKRWVRQGVISKAWLGTGEEATTIGAVAALAPGDVVGPMIRNAGACHEMGMSLADMLRGYLGTADSPSGGRDLHIGDLERGILAPISMVGSLVPVTAGVALAFKIQKRPNLALTWVGDGATKTTAFHEGMVTARALGVPLVAFIQNNQIALGTPLASHSRADLHELAALYGVSSFHCEGNNVLDVFAATRLAADSCRFGRGPVLVVAETFRMGGHATHDEGESRQILPAASFELWGKRDPIGTYENYLTEPDLDTGQSLLSREALEQAETEVSEEIERAASEALASRDNRMPAPETQQLGVLAAAE